MNNGPIVVLLAIALGSCQVTTLDNMGRAKRNIQSGDLLRAIVLLDKVPPADPAYAEARTLANAVERRMRTGQRLFAQGMRLRAEWRDVEAVRCFEMACEVWPRISGVEQMITATRHRMSALSLPVRADRAGAGEVAVTQPVDPSAAEEVRTLDADPPAVPLGEPAAAGSALEQTIWNARYQQAESWLARGRLDEALDLLESLHRQAPTNAAVLTTLARVLHQRALLHYGQGHLQQAIIGWSQVLELEPNHSQATAFLPAAQAELKAQRE
jgi:tetratricopeptide (TPR) repeat protein